MNKKWLTCLGFIYFAGVVALLYSTAGFIGPKTADTEPSPSDSFPYAMPEIKQDLAKRWGWDTALNGPLPADFFETYPYTNLIMGVMQEGNSLLGDSEDQQTFWGNLMCLRALIMDRITPRQPDDLGIGQSILSAMQLQFLSSIDKNPQKGAEILADVIRYEETHPYNPQKGIDDRRKQIQNLTKEEYLKLSGEPDITEEELAEYKQSALEWTDDIPEGFENARREILKFYQDFLKQINNGKSLEEWAEEKPRQAGITEYAVHFQAPALYPMELASAVLLLSSDEEGPIYQFPNLFLINADKINSTRIENEKPLPHKLYAAWYSITENKCYKLQTDLPLETIKEHFFAAAGTWDALLFTLEPYGQVALYAFNQINGKKEKLSAFQAEEMDLSWEDFRQIHPHYEDPNNPSGGWNDYQQKALTNHQEAKKALQAFGLPGKGFNFWKAKEYFKEPEYALPAEKDLNLLDKNGETPLINAVRTQKSLLVAQLLEAGADANTPSSSGETPLSAAVSMQQVPFVKTLLASGADVNLPEPASGRTPLMLAAMNGNVETLNLLLDAGADVHATLVFNGQDTGETALYVALENNQPEIARRLREAGAAEPASVTPEQQTPAENAADAPPSPFIEALDDSVKLKQLIDSGADVNAAVPGGSPLLLACALGNASAVQTLIAAGAKLNATDPNSGYTPLMLATLMGNTELVKILLNAGADPNAPHILNGQETGLTPLSMTKIAGNTEIEKMLLEAGAK